MAAAAPDSAAPDDDVLLSRPSVHGAYWRRHLTGRLGLARSLGLNLLLPALLLWLLLGAVDAWSRLHGSALRVSSAVLLLGWPLLLLLIGWGAIGVWRAARREDLYAESPAWRRLGAPALAVLLAVLALLQLVLQVLPQVAERAALLVWRDPLGAARMELSADGRRLRLTGAIARGDGDRFQALLQTAPAAQWLILQSDGGRLAEAQQIAAAVRTRGLATRATGTCSDVCPLVFLAGSTRQLLPGGRLGFHRLTVGPFNPPYQRWANGVQRQLLLAAGLTPHMATKALATPPALLWFPDLDELTSAALVSVPERPLDVDLPLPGTASVAEYTEALSASPLWQALERRFPGVAAEAAQRMFSAGGGGAEAVQIAGQTVVGQRLPLLLAQASPETRWLYTEILQAQVEHLRTVDAAACRGLLRGDVPALRLLPPALAWREAQWLMAALDETPSTAAPRRSTALELEVIRRTLGPRAPRQLAVMWRSPEPLPANEPDCDRSLGQLSELASIAAPERRLALRLMYERQ